MTLTSGVTESARHRTAWVEAGPAGGPLMIFVHGWPELGIMWRAQIEHFARLGWRCVAPDMRGYGGSSVPGDPGAYALREIVADMTELHDALGGAPAVWVGHDWGSPVVFSLATHHRQRCRAVASLCVPYAAAGFALENLLPLVDRDRYPADRFPDGQWSYYRFYALEFDRAAEDFEADVAATVTLLFRPGTTRSLGRPARSAQVVANGGWFGPARRAPQMPADGVLLSPADFAATVAALTANGFRGPNSWYVNDEANIAYAAEAPDGGRLTLPVLMVHATWDAICDTAGSRLADPMRADCSDLTEVAVDGGHQLMMERPAEVNAALETWLGSALSGQ
jgi:pimeloyl-ACP methyl ester carboxylesterase